MAKRVSSILERDKSVKKLIFDTTGVGYIEARRKREPDILDLNKLLEKKRSKCKITMLEEVEVEKAKAVYEVAIAGLA